MGKQNRPEEKVPQTIGANAPHDLCHIKNVLPFCFASLHGNPDALDEADDDRLFKDIHPNTELGIDLKLFTREPGRMKIGACLDGTITHDGEDHFTFTQKTEKKVVAYKRNPHFYEGKYININRKDDGTLYPTFNRPRFSKKFTFQDFCREAADELRTIAWCIDIQSSGLIEEMDFAE